MIQTPAVYYSLIARSPVIRFAIYFCLAITAVLLCFGFGFVAIGFLFLACLGLGVSVHNYRQWEGGWWAVPGFKESLTLASIHFSIALTLLTLVIVIVLHGFFWPLIGLTVLTSGLGLLFCTSRYLPLIALPVLLLLGYIEKWLDYYGLVNWISSNPFHLHEIFGVSATILGAIAPVFFYRALVHKPDKLFEKIEAKSAAVPGKQQSEIKTSNKSYWRRASNLLNPILSQRLRETLGILAGILILLTLAFYGARGSDIYAGAIIFYGAMILMACPITLFSGRLGPSFERAWILGMKNDRSGTVKQLAQLTALHSLFVFAVVIIGAALLLPFQLIQIGNATLVLSVAFGFGAFCMLVACLFFRFWYRYADWAFVAFMLITTVTAAVCTPTIETFLNALNESRYFYRNFTIAMLTTFIFSTIIWKLNIFVAARVVSRESALLE